MNKIGASDPVNKTAALVVSRGYQYEPDKKVKTHDSDHPLPIRRVTRLERRYHAFLDLTGRNFGRFTVIGLSQDHAGSWVVRCQCGRYTTRKKKAILNPENTQDRCEYCRHLAFLRRRETYRRTGKDRDIREF